MQDLRDNFLPVIHGRDQCLGSSGPHSKEITVIPAGAFSSGNTCGLPGIAGGETPCRYSFACLQITLPPLCLLHISLCGSFMPCRVEYEEGSEADRKEFRIAPVQPFHHPAVRELVTLKQLCPHSAQEIARMPEELQHAFSVKAIQEGLPKSAVEVLVAAFNAPNCPDAVKEQIVEKPRQALLRVADIRTAKTLRPKPSDKPFAPPGHEKGSIENVVAIVRNIAFTPAPRVSSYEELQAHVTNRCLAYAKNHVIRGKEHSIHHFFEEERKSLLPLPQAALDPGFATPVLVHPDLTVIHEGIRYSVPHDFVGKEVTLRLPPFHLSVYYQGKEVWKHNRMFKKQEDQYVLEHLKLDINPD